MFAWFREIQKKREIRHLNKGAPEVIDYSRQSLRAETMAQAAQLTRQHLDRAATIYGDDPMGWKRALLEYKTLHTEARRQNDHAALTAFTLVMLHIRAGQQGAPCKPAQKAIDEFIGEWAHVAEN